MKNESAMLNEVIRYRGNRQFEELSKMTLPNDSTKRGPGKFAFEVGQKVIVVSDECPIVKGIELEIKQKLIFPNGFDKYYCGGVWLNRWEIEVV